MRKKVTSKKPSTQEGIGYINNPDRFFNLYTTLVRTIGDFADTSLNTQEKVNSTKNFVDALVGRSRGNYTKTDVYQILFLASLGAMQNAIGEVPFTKVNTVVAKLTTEGQYGNTGVVRRQTTLEKFRELFSRVFNIQIQDDSKLRRMANSTWDSNTRNIASAGNFLTFIVSLSQRGQRGTTTTRVSNRTRRTTSTPARTTTPSTPARTPSTPASTSDAFGGGDRNNIFTLSIVNRETQVKAWYLASSGVANNTRAEQVGYVVLIFRYFLHESVSRLTDSAKVNITEILRVFMRLDVVANNLYSDRDINSGQLNKISDTIRVLAFVFSRYKIIKAKKMTPLLRGYTKSQIVSLTISTVGQNDTTEIDRTVYSAFYNRGDRQYRDAIAMINRMRESRVGVNPSEAKKFLNGGQVMLSYIPRVLLWPPYSSSTETTTTTTTRTTPATTSTRQVRDDNPRSTTPPESSVTPQLVREIPFTGTVGIEIEYYGVPKRILEDKLEAGGIKARDVSYTHQVTPYWKLTTDVSAEGRHSGEMVSPILKGKAGLVEARKCINICQEAGMLVNKSGGFHVHFGMQGVSVQAIKNIIVNYNNLQPIIDRMLHKWRRGSGWGASFNSTQIRKIQDATDMQDIYRAISGENRTFRNTYQDVRHSGRYHAINVFCYLNYGTIEFRQYTAVLESDTVLMWIYFLHFLIEVSKKKQLTKFDWKNVENFLPKKVATFWANRIYELGDGRDSIVTDYSSREQR